MRSCSCASVRRISPTPRSSSALVARRCHPVAVDEPRHSDDLVSAYDQGPALSVGTRNLGVDEHVLDLLAPPREPVAGPPPPYCKSWPVCLDAPAAPAHLALERDRALLEPEALV